MKKIQWNKVTWYSKLLAVVVFVATFFFAFYLGAQYEAANLTAQWITYTPPLHWATGMHCGGFIKNAPTCPTSYRCQLNKIADTGGVCVPE